MVNEAPLFSICVPAHNSLHLIEDALASVAMQTFDAWEIIVVDDCSNDGTIEWLKSQKLVPQDKLRLISLDENCGPYYSRKVSFRAARGAYVLCLDADDEFLGAEALERLSAAISDRGVLPDIVMFNATIDKAHSQAWIDYSSAGLCSGAISKDIVVDAFLGTQKLNNLWTKAIRKELLLPVDLDGARGLLMCEDRLEVAGALAKAQHFLLLDEPLYYYRPNPNSTTHRLFELGHCRQQSYVDAAIARLFPGEREVHLVHGEFLKVWADDMCLITRGRAVRAAADCYGAMAVNEFFLEAYGNTGTKALRGDRRLLLSLLHGGRYFAAALLASALYVSKEAIKCRVRYSLRRF